MEYDFDHSLDRRNTCSLKWDYCERFFGEPDVIPMWVADMDFPAPSPVVVVPNRKLLDLYRLESQRAGLELGNIFGLTALEAAYTRGAEWLDEALVYLAANVDFTAEFVRTKLPALDFVRPEGTFLALLAEALERTARAVGGHSLKWSEKDKQKLIKS